MNIFVGNLSREAKEEDIRKAFEAHGTVSSVSLIKDRFTGELRGFGFVEMPVVSQAQAAVTALNGTELSGQPLNVSEARPREPRGIAHRPHSNKFGNDRRGGGGGGGGSRGGHSDSRGGSGGGRRW